MEGDQDQENCQWRPVPCLSLEVTSWVSPGHHPLSCGARFEPTTLRYTSTCCLVMRGFQGVKREEVEWMYVEKKDNLSRHSRQLGRKPEQITICRFYSI